MRRNRLLYFSVTFLTLCLSGLGTESSLVLQNNGYHNLVIAIADDVQRPDDSGTQLLKNLQDLMKRASSFLYKATEQRAYFHSVDILIPRLWSDVSEFDIEPATSQSYSTADIRVALPSRLHGNTPFTHQSKLCGLNGEYIQLSTEFVTGGDEIVKKYGDQGKAVVHEWAHYRYGVFEEYGYPTYEQNAKYPYFYKNPEGEIVATGCSNKEIPGKIESIEDRKCSEGDDLLVDPTCRFIPDLDQDAATTSIMYMQFLKGVDSFCKAENHNPYPPNKQNILCGHRSVWDVIIGESYEFHDNDPAPGLKTDPVFRILRPQTPVIYFLIEESGENVGKGLRHLVSGLLELIKMDLSATTTAGMAKFSGPTPDPAEGKSYNTVLIEPMFLGSREKYVRALSSLKPSGSVESDPSVAIIEAIDKLAFCRDKAGSVLFIAKFSETGNFRYSEREVIHLLNTHKIRPVVMEFTTSNKNLYNIARETGGRLYHAHHEDYLDTAIGGAISAIIRIKDEPVRNPRTEIMFQHRLLTAGDVVKGGIPVDSSLGGKTMFAFELEGRGKLNVQLKSPNKAIYNSSNAEYTEKNAWNTTNGNRLVMISFPNAATGKPWIYELEYKIDQCPDCAEQSVVTIHAYSVRDFSISPIVVTVWTTAVNGVVDVAFIPFIIYVSLTQKDQNVELVIVGATVEAIVEVEGQEPISVMLRDDGYGDPDLMKDGTYSGYFIPRVDGEHRISISVRGRQRKPAPKRGTSQVMPVNQGDFCCGSTYMDLLPGSAWYFQRYQKNIVKVNVKYVDLQMTYPQRVMDMEITNATETVDEHVDITLEWTAPGAEFVLGTVDNYDLHYSTSPGDLLGEKFDFASALYEENVVSGSLAPLPAGHRQNVTVRLPAPQYTTTYHFSIRGFSERLGPAKYASPIAWIALGTGDPPKTTTAKTTKSHVATPEKQPSSSWMMSTEASVGTDNSVEQTAKGTEQAEATTTESSKIDIPNLIPRDNSGSRCHSHAIILRFTLMQIVLSSVL